MITQILAKIKGEFMGIYILSAPADNLRIGDTVRVRPIGGGEWKKLAIHNIIKEDTGTVYYLKIW